MQIEIENRSELLSLYLGRKSYSCNSKDFSLSVVNLMEQRKPHALDLMPETTGYGVP